MDNAARFQALRSYMKNSRDYDGAVIGDASSAILRLAGAGGVEMD
jgi:hypothetical protein